MSYCSAIPNMKSESKKIHSKYHDFHYGFPIYNDNDLFGRLILEINQAGLSWETILKKEEHFKKAYHQFQINKVAKYKEKDIERLLNNPGIIRNKLKINAAIYNANQIIKIQKEYGSFYNWIEKHHPLKKEDWVKLFKQNFKFTGGEIVNEFLMSIGVLPGAHDSSCLIYKKIMKKKPLWLERPIKS